jgi:hypothetical protein
MAAQTIVKIACFIVTSLTARLHDIYFADRRGSRIDLNQSAAPTTQLAQASFADLPSATLWNFIRIVV